MTKAKSKITFVGQKEVAIGDLKAHPDNPNRGSVEDLTESLGEFGQYRAIVATKDLTILAGHHVVEAAKTLKMAMVRVDVIDTDEKTARKIMLADNWLAKLGQGPDLEILLRNFEDLDGDLVGTGYDEDYVQLLEEAISGPPQDEDQGGSGGGGPGGLSKLSLSVETALAKHWEAHRKLFPDDSSALAYILGG